MTEEERDQRLNSIDTRLGNLEKTSQGHGERLARLEGLVGEMSNGLTRLTWVVSLWGSVISILVGFMMLRLK